MIENANIAFDKDSGLYAVNFTDRYFQLDAQSEVNHVFIAANNLWLRWQQYPLRTFVIAEIGFGTGLNFLLTAILFNEFKKKYPQKTIHLHYIAFEKYPIATNKLRTILDRWPELQALSEQLLQYYPKLVVGPQQIQFTTSIQLDLWLGDADKQLAEVYSDTPGIIDCWYFDGFAPSKNPSLWSASIWKEVARLSKIGASFSTFTVAGKVREGLMAAGFTIRKKEGFGQKKEMLVGTFTGEKKQHQPLLYHGPSTLSPASHIAIFGAGIAGACMAAHLTQQGYQVTLFEQQQQAGQGASNQPQAGFYPSVNREWGLYSQWGIQSFLYAQHFYQQLLTQGGNFTHDFCGVLALAEEKKYHWKIEEFATYYQQQQATTVAGITVKTGGLFFHEGGWINLPELVEAILFFAQQQLGSLTLLYNQTITAINYHNHQWLITQNERTQAVDFIIDCTGPKVGSLLPQSLGIVPIQGQVSRIAVGGQQFNHCVINQGLYMMPSAGQQMSIGASFEREQTESTYSEAVDQRNWLKLEQLIVDETIRAQLKPNLPGVHGVRAATNNHLPCIGPVPDDTWYRKNYHDLHHGKRLTYYPRAQNIPQYYVLSGLGSHGLCSAPFAAAILGRLLQGQPLPVSTQLLGQISANRYLLNKLRRKNSYN